MPRNYKQEYENYQGTEASKQDRAQRNRARRMLEKKGVVHKGDGKDVDHKKPVSKGGATTRSNLRVKTASANRTFDRKSDHSIK
jgi:hypothetical protein